jgi:hypothetical protein
MDAGFLLSMSDSPKQGKKYCIPEAPVPRHADRETRQEIF